MAMRGGMLSHLLDRRQRLALAVVADLHHYRQDEHNASGDQRNWERDVTISNAHVRMHTVQGGEDDDSEDGKQQDYRKAQQRPDEGYESNANRHAVPVRRSG